MGKIEQCLQELGYAIVPVQGTSMWPLLREKKSWVEVTIRDGTPLTSETVVLYRRENGQLVLHRIIRVENLQYLTPLCIGCTLPHIIHIILFPRCCRFHRLCRIPQHQVSDSFVISNNPKTL